MADTNSMAAENDMDQLRSFVVGQLNAGVDRNSIIRKLTNDMGMGNSDATQLVTLMYARFRKAAEEQKVTFTSLIPAIIGGCTGAVVGGIIWGMIVIITNYEIGYVAIGIGFLTGYGVVLFSGGKRGLPLQLIAVASSVLGIAIGKYVTFYNALKDYVAGEVGEDAAAQMSVASLGVMQTFMENLGEMLGGYDILWVILAFVTAWSIPKSKGVELSR